MLRTVRTAGGRFHQAYTVSALCILSQAQRHAFVAHHFSGHLLPYRLVGLFKPPEELSALVVMELLYYYALAHQDSFDVRWIKNGTVADSLIAPMATKLQEEYGLEVMGGCRVGKITLEPLDTKLHASTVEYTTSSGETKTISDIDGIVLALGCKGMESVVKSSNDLARLPVFSEAASLKGIDVISVRLWLDTVVPTRTPANVFSRFDALRGAGGTFFMLDQLQENNPDLWGEGGEVQGSVVACDFYNAGALLSLCDEDIVRILMEDLLPRYVCFLLWVLFGGLSRLLLTILLQQRRAQVCRRQGGGFLGWKVSWNRELVLSR